MLASYRLNNDHESYPTNRKFIIILSHKANLQQFSEKLFLACVIKVIKNHEI